MPEVAAGAWRLRAKVPDGIFTLAIEADDDGARAEHAAFADRCLARLPAADADPQQVRLDIISQLAGLRRAVAGGGLGYLGAMAEVRDDRPALLLLGIAVTPLSLPGGIDPAGLLGAMLRHDYPDAHVEEFPTSTGVGVGLQHFRDQVLDGVLPGDEPATLTTGIAQALVPFPEAGLLGTAVGLSLAAADIDLATIFAATIACQMTVAR
jgi:hypothetical protein